MKQMALAVALDPEYDAAGASAIQPPFADHPASKRTDGMPDRSALHGCCGCGASQWKVTKGEPPVCEMYAIPSGAMATVVSAQVVGGRDHRSRRPGD